MTDKARAVVHQHGDKAVYPALRTAVIRHRALDSNDPQGEAG